MLKCILSIIIFSWVYTVFSNYQQNVPHIIVMVLNGIFDEKTFYTIRSSQNDNKTNADHKKIYHWNKRRNLTFTSFIVLMINGRILFYNLCKIMKFLQDSYEGRIYLLIFFMLN